MPNAIKPEPTFLWPSAQQFAVDTICNEIVREMSRRNWQVPGIEVEFNTYGSGEEKYQLVRKVTGEEFSLYFGRPVGRLGGYNNTSGIDTINIPQLELGLYDNGAMSTHTYISDNWAADKQRFERHIKIDSKLKGEDPWYLLYRTSSPGGMFAIETDLGREYGATNDQLSAFPADVVFEKITDWLELHVLNTVLAVEPATDEERVSPTAMLRAEPQSVRTDLPPIYCYAEARDAFRMQHIDDPEYGFGASDRYGLHSNWRLMTLGVRDDDPVPEVAYEGFVWCGFGTTGDVPLPSELSLHYSWLEPKDRCYIVQVKLNRQNDVYICDNAAFLNKRAEISETLPADFDRFTPDQVNQQHLARARTLIPISEYDFTNPYEQPLVLIERELDLDEVEILTGPWRHKMREWQLVPDES